MEESFIQNIGDIPQLDQESRDKITNATKEHIGSLVMTSDTQSVT